MGMVGPVASAACHSDQTSNLHRDLPGLPIQHACQTSSGSISPMTMSYMMYYEVAQGTGNNYASTV
eukprot:1028939-Amphidinium_carterae.1